MRKSASDNRTNLENVETWGKGLNVGDTIEGVYMACEEFPSKFNPNKQNYRYIIRDSGGTLHGIYSTAVIDRSFKEIPLNAYVWIEYKGETQTDNGRQVKLFSIDYDDEYQG